MRFFSNDAAKENTEEQAHDDRMQVEQATVPQQRAGSPWSDAPGTAEPAEWPGATGTDTADAELADRESRDGAETDSPTDGGEVRHDQTDTVRDTEAHGSHAVRPEDLAADSGPDDRSGDDDTLVRDTGDAGPTDEPVTYGPDGTVRAADGPAVDQEGADEGRLGGEEDSPEQAALRDEGDFDSPRAVDPSTGEPLDSAQPVDGSQPVDRGITGDSGLTGDSAGAGDTVAGTGDTVEAHDERHADGSLPAEAGSPETTPVAATVNDTSAADTRTDGLAAATTATDADAAPAVVAAGTTTGEKPGAVTVTTTDRLFTDGATFVERFREIQLRFVDSPKEATGDAARLIGEAVDVLTNALNTQRDSLTSNSEDTEKLRVELRGYRDILNRLTSL